MSIEFDLFRIIVPALITFVGGSLATVLGKYQTNQSNNELKKIEKLTTIITEKKENSLASDIVTIVEKLPDGMSREEYFSNLKEVLIEIEDEKNDNDDELEIIEELLKSYHSQALLQSSIQFWFSLFAAVVGFALVIYMCIGSSNKEPIAIIASGLPGIAVDAVAILFFRQANETRKKATELFDKLRTDKQLSKSIVIAEKIEDSILRSAVLSQIALSMSGISSSLEDINKVINIQEK